MCPRLLIAWLCGIKAQPRAAAFAPWSPDQRWPQYFLSFSSFDSFSEQVGRLCLSVLVTMQKTPTPPKVILLSASFSSRCCIAPRAICVKLSSTLKVAVFFFDKAVMLLFVCSRHLMPNEWTLYLIHGIFRARQHTRHHTGIFPDCFNSLQNIMVSWSAIACSFPSSEALSKPNPTRLFTRFSSSSCLIQNQFARFEFLKKLRPGIKSLGGLSDACRGLSVMTNMGK